MVQGSISWTQLYPRSGRFRFQYQEPYSLLYQVDLGFNVIISLFNSSGTDFFTLDDTDTKQFANLGCFGLYDKYGSLCLLYKYKLCLSVGLFPIKDDKFWQKTCRNLLFLKMHQFNQKKPRKFKTQSVPGEVKFTIMKYFWKNECKYTNMYFHPVNLMILRPNLKNLSRGLNWSRGSNMVGSTENCIQFFKI